MSRNKLYQSRIELCLTPQQKKELENAARKKSMRVNELIRLIINDYLSN